MKRAAILVALALAAAAPPKAPDRTALVAALRTQAAQGNAEAAYHLGMMRHLGIGGLKDEQAAFELFKQAAEGGDPLAAYKLGDYYARPDNGFVAVDKAEALRLKTIAAEAGYALAQHDVARLQFEAGRTDEALEWLEKAGRQGNAEALRALASLYNSDALPKNAAFTWAYYSLYLKQLTAPTEAHTRFVTEFEAKMSEEDRERGAKVLADWKTETSPITSKAQSGLRAAETLIARE